MTPVERPRGPAARAAAAAPASGADAAPAVPDAPGASAPAGPAEPPAPLEAPAIERVAGEHVPALDGLRGIAILLVLVLHTCVRPEMLAGRSVTAADLRWAEIVTAGWAGVDLFFVLSGFLITSILLRTRERPRYLRNFFARRALRILPLYYAVVLAHLVVLPPGVVPSTEKFALLTYWVNFWQAANPELAIGPQPSLLVTWSLAIEEQFYLVWPFVVLWLSRRALVALCASLLVLAPLLRFALDAAGAHWWATYALTPCRVDTLATGALLALLGPRPGRAARAVTLAAAGGLVLVARAQDGWEPQGTPMHTVGFSLVALLSAGVLVLATGRGALARLCSQRWLRLFGKHSYAIYLVHLPVAALLAPLFLGPRAKVPLLRLADATGVLWPTSIAFVLVSGAACLLAGVVIWHAFERHFLRLKSRFGGRPPGRG